MDHEKREFINRIVKKIDEPKIACAVHVSTSILRGLERNTVNAVQVSENGMTGGLSMKAHGIPVHHKPEIQDGCYMIEFRDGTFQFCSPEKSLDSEAGCGE